jgi:hypothetical protein
MRSRIERLNVRDDELATNKKILDVVSWEAVKNDAELQDACKNNQLSRRFLDELYYMSAFYEKPLSANRRMRMRNLLLDLYDSSSTTEDEKRYIVSIMNYFELLDETNLNQ